ncbi:MAG: hypothetical protein COS95_09155 [Ignavibacteriales bacterium CG07_land_8_20_14_0_80_59_12]|nr:MAG: hypothetical protein COS95_09155 [Ignavibacteriales bacterium CG07_land_8_20_14_0_80_59_12]
MKGISVFVTLFLTSVRILSLSAASRPDSAKDSTGTTPAVLMQLDREFNRATAERGIDGWVAYFAENGSMASEKEPPITGHAAIREAMGKTFSNPDFSLHWRPEHAGMMIPGILGYTAGKYENHRKNTDGKTVIRRGRYCSVWRIQADGSWKIVLDTGSQEGPPTSQP